MTNTNAGNTTYTPIIEPLLAASINVGFQSTISADSNDLSDAGVLKEYKEQINVENNFKVLKDPYFVDGIYLKTPERVEALGYVMLLALMVYTSIERETRKALQEENEAVIIPGKVKTRTPTGNAILETFEKIIVLIMTYENGITQRVIISKMTANMERILNLSGFGREIYTEEYLC